MLRLPAIPNEPSESSANLICSSETTSRQKRGPRTPFKPGGHCVVGPHDCGRQDDPHHRRHRVLWAEVCGASPEDAAPSGHPNLLEGRVEAGPDADPV